MIAGKEAYLKYLFFTNHTKGLWIMDIKQLKYFVAIIEGDHHGRGKAPSCFAAASFESDAFSGK